MSERGWQVESLILRTAARAVVAVLAVLALFIYWVGHNQPGGGFVAGLLVSAAIAVGALAYGAGAAARLVPWPAHALAALGLSLALGTGLGSWGFGHPFLTHGFGHFELPLLGEFELATAAIFDLGVFLVVLGTVKSILVAIATERGVPAPRPSTAGPAPPARDQATPDGGGR